MNKVIQSGHLKGSYRCSFKREHDIPLETGKRKENVYDKAVLIKEIIKNGIYHGYDKEQIKEKIIQAYEKMDYPTAETARLHAMDTYRQVMRYLTCESRKPAGAASQKICAVWKCDRILSSGATGILNGWCTMEKNARE